MRAKKRLMATTTKKAMATDGDNTGNGYGKVSGGRLTAAAMGMAQRKLHLMLQLEREMMVAIDHGLCVCFGVCGETTKIRKRAKKL